ncbi:MAG: hypothetical protein GY856_41525 [bacterium]|nr:hypothetical protein [bacterium]
MTRNAVTVTVLFTILLGSAPPATQADEIYAAGPGELWRLGTDSNRTTVVGPLDVFFTALAFSSGGELYGLDRDNGLHRVDPESAETESLLTLDGSLLYWDFTVAPGGDLYLIRDPRGGPPGTELTRLDPTGGTETLVARLAQAFYTLFSSDSQLIGESFDGRFYTIDPLSGLTEELPGAGDFGWGFDLDLDSDGVLWVLADTAVDPSPRMLFARDFESGESRSDKAYYYWDFLYDGPSAFAIRRDPSADCLSDFLCLAGERFQISLSWRDFDGISGVGHPVDVRSDNAGLFWFFSPENWEILVKVLDGCGINQRFWIFAAATTNVEFTLTAVDLASGAEQTYSNPLGNTADTIIDTDAFATCP